MISAEGLKNSIKNLKNLDKQQQQYLVLGVLGVCIVFVLYYYLLLNPKMTNVGTLLSEIKQLREEVTTAKEDISRRDVLTRRLKELEEGLDHYQKVIPKDSDFSGILSDLSQEAKASRMTLQGVEPIQEVTATKDRFKVIRIALQLKGSYHTLGTFLNRLENGTRFIDVDAFEINADPQSVTEHKIKLYIRTYVSEGEKK